MDLSLRCCRKSITLMLLINCKAAMGKWGGREDNVYYVSIGQVLTEIDIIYYEN